MSSYGGTLHYELHSETQRGDIFIPYESRPDVVLQVVGRSGVANGIVDQPSCQPSPGPCVWFSGQPNEHRLPGTGVPSAWPGSPRTATAGRGEQSWPGAQQGPKGAAALIVSTMENADVRRRQRLPGFLSDHP